MAIRETLLHSSCQDKHLAQAQRIHAFLVPHAKALLESHLQKSSPDIRAFYNKYRHLLGAWGIGRVVQWYRKNPDVEKQADWTSTVSI